MDVFEEMVLKYLCGNPSRFVSSQFTFPSKTGGGTWSCPDFIALDFSDSTVYIIEVTTAENSKDTCSKIANREFQWLGPLRDHLKKLNPMFTDWRYHVTLFVREEEVARAQRILSAVPDASVISLDKAVFPWRWTYEGQAATNPLRIEVEAK
jgi:hypothetical protein